MASLVAPMSPWGQASGTMATTGPRPEAVRCSASRYNTRSGDHTKSGTLS